MRGPTTRRGRSVVANYESGPNVLYRTRDVGATLLVRPLKRPGPDVARSERRAALSGARAIRVMDGGSGYCSQNAYGAHFRGCRRARRTTSSCACQGTRRRPRTRHGATGVVVAVDIWFQPHQPAAPDGTADAAATVRQRSRRRGAPLPIPAPTPAPTTDGTVWDLLGGRYLTIVIIIAVLAFVACAARHGVDRTPIRRRRQTKEQNATAQDVPAMVARCLRQCRRAWASAGARDVRCRRHSAARRGPNRRARRDASEPPPPAIGLGCVRVILTPARSQVDGECALTTATTAPRACAGASKMSADLLGLLTGASLGGRSVNQDRTPVLHPRFSRCRRTDAARACSITHDALRRATRTSAARLARRVHLHLLRHWTARATAPRLVDARATPSPRREDEVGSAGANPSCPTTPPRRYHPAAACGGRTRARRTSRSTSRRRSAATSSCCRTRLCGCGRGRQRGRGRVRRARCGSVRPNRPSGRSLARVHGAEAEQVCRKAHTGRCTVCKNIGTV